MALIDRVAPDATGTIQVPAHEFCAALFFWAIGTMTRANVVTMFGLQSSDDAQLDALASAYTALANDGLKQAFLRKIEAGAILLQAGRITKAQYLSALGF